MANIAYDYTPKAVLDDGSMVVEVTLSDGSKDTWRLQGCPTDPADVPAWIAGHIAAYEDETAALKAEREAKAMPDIAALIGKKASAANAMTELKVGE